MSLLYFLPSGELHIGPERCSSIQVLITGKRQKPINTAATIPTSTSTTIKHYKFHLMIIDCANVYLGKREVFLCGVCLSDQIFQKIKYNLLPNIRNKTWRPFLRILLVSKSGNAIPLATRKFTCIPRELHKGRGKGWNGNLPHRSELIRLPLNGDHTSNTEQKNYQVSQNLMSAT